EHSWRPKQPVVVLRTAFYPLQPDPHLWWPAADLPSMKTRRILQVEQLHRTAADAFTLIEIMVVVVLLSLIILGLLLMFDQTEKAFLTGTAQTDQLEAGRMFNDFLLRDMEQIVPGGHTNTVNFWAHIPNYGTLQPLQQTLPPGSVRTNLLEDLYFVSRVNQTI